MLPRPTVIVDTWAFRLVDPQGNLIGRQEGVLVIDPTTGAVTSITPMPGVQRTVTALPTVS
jgi:hypothetical protein